MANPTGVNGSGKGGRPLADALRVELLRNDGRQLKALIASTVRAAIAGEAWAAQLVYDRIDGRVPQPVVGDADHPVKLQIEWKLSPINDLPMAQPELPAIEATGVQPIDCTPELEVIEPARKIA